LDSTIWEAVPCRCVTGVRVRHARAELSARQCVGVPVPPIDRAVAARMGLQRAWMELHFRCFALCSAAGFRVDTRSFPSARARA
jgi:hypothetical protein